MTNNFGKEYEEALYLFILTQEAVLYFGHIKYKRKLWEKN